MNKLDLKKLPSDIYALLVEIGAQADLKRVPIFLVGGMVRDLILRRPSRDIDIVVEGDGVLFANELAARWSANILAHKKFGTAVIERADGFKIDIVTARRESYARPGALPDVVPGHIADDLFRRDFTVNAVAVALNKAEFGAVYDDFDGCADIKGQVIRVMHYRSFVDDPTRILRAVRYEKRFGFKFDPRTLAVLRQALDENAFGAISPKRYFGEFKRILQEADPRAALRRLALLDGLRYFVYDAGVEAAFKKILKSKLSGDARWLELFAALVAALDRESAEQLLVSFSMPRLEKNKILKGLL
ncbi:MAG: CCA tRNA nucleotidyltransferase [Candidatus Omnitrophica bacterium]|nr:CCA tRNA nucleotidyltransferase [Candidatus Omnitrophota bacterium]